ncbi:MAG: SdrD B-like domain-containing protein [Acidimicrobiales bacterium]
MGKWSRVALVCATVTAVLGVVGVGTSGADPVGSIGNRVWVDLNANGFRDPGEPGLAGVVVSLRGEGPGGLTGRTTVGGWYGFDTFDSTDCFRLSITIPEGYVASPSVGPSGPTASRIQPDGTVAEPVCGTGTEQNDWDAGVVPQNGAPSASTGHIGNRVFDDRNGNGVRDGGEPGIAGVRVTLSDVGGTPLVSGATAAGGWYGFSGLDESACYRVAITVPAGRLATSPDAGSDDNVDSDAGPTGAFTTPVCLTPSNASQDQWDAGLISAPAPPTTTTIPPGPTTTEPVRTTTTLPTDILPPDGTLPRPTLASARASGIAVGENIGCAVITDGTVRCWGFNGIGQLGDGTTVNSADPVAVAGVAGATQVVVTGYSACALLSGGTVSCWGDDQRGYRHTSVNPAALAKPLAGAAELTQIAGNQVGVCGIGAARTVTCWLDDLSSPTGFTSAVSIPGLTDVLRVSVGGDRACVIRADGTVWCWGMSRNGPTVEVPLQVAGAANATQVALDRASNATCASLVGGEVVCWGANDDGQLGNGTQELSVTPVLVGGNLPPVRDIGMGGLAACAVGVDGAARCWGQYLDDPVHPFETPRHLTPVAVPGLTDVADIEISLGMTVALRTDGSVWVWRVGGLPTPITGLPQGTPVPGNW